jgi:hypothetical protein
MGKKKLSRIIVLDEVTSVDRAIFTDRERAKEKDSERASERERESRSERRRKREKSEDGEEQLDCSVSNMLTYADVC